MHVRAAAPGARDEDIDTPAPLVDLDVVEANILKLQQHLDEHGLRVRPHIKTHKSVAMAHKQLAAGAYGITCQKLSEAEVMVDAGISDVLITYNMVGNAKLHRLAMLSRRATVSVTVDSVEVADNMSKALAKAEATVGVLVECDSGGHRCGVQSPADAARLASRINKMDALTFMGLMTYPSGPGVGAWMDQAKKACEATGLTPAVISGGGTPGVWDPENLQGFTEYRAGVYIYNDRSIVSKGAAGWSDCALTVLATVVSRPTEDRAILDAGSKALTSDTLGLNGHGRIREYPEAVIETLSEEHAVVDLSSSTDKPAIGEKVTVVPNHACVVSNLFDEVYGIRRNVVEAVIPVSARGHVR